MPFCIIVKLHKTTIYAKILRHKRNVISATPPPVPSPDRTSNGASLSQKVVVGKSFLLQGYFLVLKSTV